MFRVPASLLTVVVLVAGCATTPPEQPPSVAPSLRPSPAPVPSPSEDIRPSPDLHGASDLEALLPDNAGTTTLTKVSLSGVDFYAGGTANGQSQLDELLGELEATIGDLSVA